MSPSPADTNPDPARPKRDYEVGYGRPPVATRFRPGGLGNPKGRPKRAKTVGQTIQDAMMTPVKIEVNGNAKTMTAQEVIIRNLVHSAARGDIRAIHALFALKARYQDSADTTLVPSDIEASDRKIIEEYFAKVGAPGSENAAPQLTDDGTTETSDQTARTDTKPTPDATRNR
ncbi:MAG: DUF5681 domain-containing protein [Xanthobacteraceae bacterium]